MITTLEHTEKLISAFSSDYMEKLFYFCLKKTGSVPEAEDLASDITVNVIAGLRKGTVPEHFPAWVWGVARNRYAAWAGRKRRRTETVSDMELDALEVPDDAGIDDAFLRGEELKLLRRELAFISKDYRDIVVAYYIEDRKVDDIADTLGLPGGTVMSKLFRLRKILKEGMAMAREFGVMSYKPEDVGFIMNGSSGRAGEPWSIYTRVLCKNILLAAYRTPSTAEELAVELGVALPYMEDELRMLTASTLLKKNGDRYETNIFIVSAEGQKKIYENLRSVTPALTEKIIALTEYRTKCDEENGFVWHESYQPYEDMKWALLMRMADSVYFDVIQSRAEKITNPNLGRYGFTKRPNGGEWDLLGLEDYKGPRAAFVGLHGCGIDMPEHAPVINFGQFKFMYKNINDKTPLNITYEQGKALVAAAMKDTAGVSAPVLEELSKYGYLKKDGDTYTPAFFVSFTNKTGQWSPGQKAEHDRLRKEAQAIADGHHLFCRDVIHEEIPAFLKDDAYQIGYAVKNMLQLRGAILEEALRTGYITYDENDGRRMLGAYLYI